MTTNHDDCPICAMMADNDDLRLTDAYRVRNQGSGEVLSMHPTFRQAMDAADESEQHETQPVCIVEELIDGRWVSAH